MTAEYDFIVVGGGSGGIASANRAAAYGARVLLIEQDRLGGTCVNRGCVPKKVMWYAANYASAFAEAKDYGFDSQQLSLDWGRLVERREAYIKRLNDIYARGLDKSKVDVCHGSAHFVDSHTVAVGDQHFHGKHTLIATGAHPFVPAIEGAELGITSDDFFRLHRQPKHVAIVGVGYIGVELAGVLHQLGSQVHLLARHSSVLRDFDHSLGAALMEAMRQQGIDLLTKALPKRLTKHGHGLTLELEDGRQLCGLDCVVWATGRNPNSQALALDRAGVTVDRRGFITTNDYQETGIPGIYAVGDVTGRAALTPVAIAAGRRLADRLFNQDVNAKLDYTMIPSVIFSHPPIGTVGLSEIAARQHYGDTIRIYQSSFTPLRYGITLEKPKTTMKLITQGEDERIVGCHVIGEGADEMLQGFAVAIKMGATKRDFDNTVAIHPTAAEEFVTLR